MTDPPASSGSPSAGVAQTHRIFALTLCTAPIMILIVMFFVLPLGDEEPPVPVILGLVALALAGFFLAEFLGFGVPALEASAGDHTATSLARYQQSTLMRFVLSEAPIIVALALSFILDYGLWPFLLVVVIALPIMWFEVYPTRRNVGKVADLLEANGTRSGLRTAFGHN